METWAFGTSPYGLALSERKLWTITPRQYIALRKQWEAARKYQETMFAQLRADVYNSSERLQRADKRLWEAADFGADPPKTQWKHPRSTMTPEQIKRRAIQLYGPHGRGRRGAPAEMPTLKALKGTGQPIPIRKEA